MRLTTVVYIAALRARAIIFDKISQRLRFLCNSNALTEDFTHLSLAPFLDQLEKLLLNVMRRSFKRAAALTTADDKYDKAQKLFKRGLTCLEDLTKLCSDENGNICEQANIVGKQREALKHNIRVAVHAYG